ncbi:hypothetical protein MXD81_24690, partial [Microbacteriaceae bacterium K1510]|nr:hypothetical protein [Microbacteriaceae bacterium K1510]
SAFFRQIVHGYRAAQTAARDENARRTLSALPHMTSKKAVFCRISWHAGSATIVNGRAVCR